ncbi:MAG: hypothetical protein IJL70_02670 [Treponema sp.]|nr:hypothetical protein [Treponema sp.]
MFNSIFYYLFGCSVIFYYGIGLNRLLTLKKTYSSFLFNIIKSLIITLVPVTLSYFVMHFVLIPLKMVELFPFVTILILISVAIPVHMMIRTGTPDLTEDYALPFLSVILSLNEQTSLINGLVICICCISAFYLFLILIFAFRRRYRLYTSEDGFKPYTLLLISIAVVIIAFFGVNNSWLLHGLN